jgi:hypothetical protein
MPEQKFHNCCHAFWPEEVRILFHGFMEMLTGKIIDVKLEGNKQAKQSDF